MPFQDGLLLFLPAIIEAFRPPIEVPAIIFIFILLFARALNTPQPKAPKEPPPWSIRTFSIVSDIFDIINTSGLLLISQAFSRAVLGIRCYIGNWQGFKRILVTSEGMSVVIMMWMTLL